MILRLNDVCSQGIARNGYAFLVEKERCFNCGKAVFLYSNRENSFFTFARISAGEEYAPGIVGKYREEEFFYGIYAF